MKTSDNVTGIKVWAIPKRVLQNAIITTRTAGETTGTTDAAAITATGITVTQAK